MTTKVAINGFGRIGRMVLRAWLEGDYPNIEVVALNDLCPVKTSAHLLKYDSVHGMLPQAVRAEADAIVVGEQRIAVSAIRDPAQLPWQQLGIDVVLECSGVFTDGDKAAAHLQAGARKVLISAPAKNVSKTIVFGVNHQELSADDRVVSNASCTTNCLAPVAKVLHDAVGIQHGYMSTIHSFTGDQRTVDTAHSDLHRARAASMNIIPTSTGAARAVGLVLPALAGKLDGCALRVPTPDVSLIDFKFQSARKTSVEEINAAVVAASQGSALQGILTVNSEPLVSSDFIHNSASSIFDLGQTQVMADDFVRVVSWYDNEWGFSCRMLDSGQVLARL